MGPLLRCQIIQKKIEFIIFTDILDYSKAAKAIYCGYHQQQWCLLANFEATHDLKL